MSGSFGSPSAGKRSSPFPTPTSAKKSAATKAEPVSEIKFVVYHMGGGLITRSASKDRPKGAAIMVGVAEDPSDNKRALAIVYASDPVNSARLDTFLEAAEMVSSGAMIVMRDVEVVHGSVESNVYQFAKPFNLRIKIVGGSSFEVVQSAVSVWEWALEKVPSTNISATGWGTFIGGFTTSEINTFMNDRAAKRSVVWDGSSKSGGGYLKLWTFEADDMAAEVMQGALVYDPDCMDLTTLKKSLFLIVSGGHKDDDDSVTINAFGMLVPIANSTALLLGRKRLADALSTNPGAGGGGPSSAAAALPVCPRGEPLCELSLAKEAEQFLDSDGVMCVKFVLVGEDKKRYTAFVSAPVVMIELFGAEIDLLGIKNIKAALEAQGANQEEKLMAMDMVRQSTVRGRMVVDGSGFIVKKL